MELYVCRSGAIEGPHPTETVQAMLQQGLLTPADLGAPVGASDWCPLSQLVACPAARAAPAGGPPPLRAAPDTRYLDQQFRISGKVLAGTEGKSVRRIIDEVAAGGRLVVFRYVYSVVILTFRRNSPIIYIAPGCSGAGTALTWSLIPLCFGWWGFPWGIVFTIAALWRNTSGGIDVTEPILAQLTSPAQADAIIRRRPKHPTGALWGLRALMVSPLVLLALLIVLLAASDSSAEKAPSKHPAGQVRP